MKTHTYVEHALREKAHVGSALTVEGCNWAIDHQDTSLTARIALAAVTGAANDWPHTHREAAIAACNAAGEKS